MLLIAGTSLNVGPVNELPFYARYVNPHLKQVWLNNEPPPIDYDFFLDFPLADLGTFTTHLKNFSTLA